MQRQGSLRTQVTRTKKKKKKKSRSPSLRRNEVVDISPPRYRPEYRLPTHARPEDYRFAKQAGQIPVGSEDYRKREAERTQERLQVYKDMPPYTPQRARSVSRPRSSASRSYSASPPPPPHPPGPPDEGIKFKAEQAKHLEQLEKSGFHQRHMSAGYEPAKEEYDPPEYEEYVQVPEQSGGQPVPVRMRTKADVEHARRQMAGGWSATGSMPGGLQSVSRSLTLSQQAARSASRGDSFTGVIHPGGTISESRRRGRKSMSREPEDITRPAKRGRPDILGSATAAERDAFMHTRSKVDLLGNPVPRPRTDLSILSRLVRSAVGAAGIRPLTPTAEDRPRSPKRQRRPEKKTLEEAIGIIRDKTGRLIPKAHKKFVKEHTRVGTRVKDMTGQQLDDERDLFHADMNSRWERKMRKALGPGK